MQQEWGLPCTVTPRFTARLVQERHNHRAAITGKFSSPDLLHIDQAFPVLMKQLELKLADGELSPCQQRTVTLYAKGLTCEADTLGSCGYVYIAIYPTQR